MVCAQFIFTFSCINREKEIIKNSLWYIFKWKQEKRKRKPRKKSSWSENTRKKEGKEKRKEGKSHYNNVVFRNVIIMLLINDVLKMSLFSVYNSGFHGGHTMKPESCEQYLQVTEKLLHKHTHQWFTVAPKSVHNIKYFHFRFPYGGD